MKIRASHGNPVVVLLSRAGVFAIAPRGVVGLKKPRVESAGFVQ